VNSFLAARSRPLVYPITDRTRLAEPSQLHRLNSYIRHLVDAGVDLIQIRERDLSARKLLEVADVASGVAGGSAAVLINDRADLAAAAGVGVHLTTRSLEAGTVRKLFADMLIGVSTHNQREASAAEDGGADFIVFGPLFDTESKRQYGLPVGLKALEAVANRVNLPILGLGGITLENCARVIEAGAAGVAGISLFSESVDLTQSVRAIRNSSVAPHR
jgi:thiamine-phosphate pyrophosphorylase